MFESFRRENMTGARTNQFQSMEQVRQMSAFAESMYNPQYMDEFAISHLPQVELVRENMTKIETILKRGSDEAHPGKFLLCRVVEVQSFTAVTVGFTLDDPDGKYALPFLFISPGVILQRGEAVPFDLNAFFSSIPAGSVLAIMNPWLTMSKKLESRNPYHIVVLGRHHSLFDDGSVRFKIPLPSGKASVMSFDNLEPKDAGVKYFAAKNYILALECFTKALKKCEDNDKEGQARQYANRSMANLCLFKPESALEDAGKGLDLDPKNEKLIYRKARSLFQFERYSECCQFLKDKEVVFGDNRDLNGLLSNARILQLESQRGEFDVAKMTEQAGKNPVLEDHAEYFDEESLEIRKVRKYPDDEDSKTLTNRLFAKKTISAGSLLIASKAFVFYPKVEKFTCQLCSRKGKHDHPEVTVEPWKQLITICSAKFTTNPACFEEFKILGSFEKYSKEERDNMEDDSDEEDLPEEYRNEEKKNAGSDRFAYGERSEINDICEENICYTTNPGTMTNYAGIWIRPSLIERKKKDANCTKSFIGNFMFVRSSKEIQPGEQLILQKESNKK